MLDQDRTPEASDLAAFLDAANTPYHAVSELARRLTAAGFRAFREQDAWQLTAGTRGFVVRAGGSIVAFEVGSKPPAEAGFVLIGAHSDSPNLRLKPVPDVTSVGFRQLSVEIYGGVLLSTWLDRDLSVAGRVVFADGHSELIDLKRSVCRVPNLAIHLNRDVNSSGLVLNAQTHLLPVLGLESESGAFSELLREGLADTASNGARVEDVLGFDLCLYDTQRAAFAGGKNEFLFSSRLDNLASCHAALRALLDAAPDPEATRIIAIYDHEEVGSQSASGARSLLLSDLLERIARACSPKDESALARATSRSLLISADMAHAVHPNYPDKHDKQHRPMLGAGPVIKVNVNQSYASDGPGVAAFSAACRAVDVTPQHFSSRNDSPCGSTIGPISAARLGVRAVDVGNPMLSMHSCREMAASRDVAPMIRVLTRLFSEFRGLDSAL
ncbi:MAG TPA: M18 family aminopeptidase [Polyangiaceae bacterium]|nr:M18 family aminopeptidase [Polyangiaceae bacterium]